uniref:Uncharacterized protein n=1 Tax=Triticum urartu TaxID=4572 RepID=A0A8R7NXR1_TRIUA
PFRFPLLFKPPLLFLLAHSRFPLLSLFTSKPCPPPPLAGRSPQVRRWARRRAGSGAS